MRDKRLARDRTRLELAARRDYDCSVPAVKTAVVGVQRLSGRSLTVTSLLTHGKARPALKSYNSREKTRQRKARMISRYKRRRSEGRAWGGGGPSWEAVRGGDGRGGGGWGGGGRYNRRGLVRMPGSLSDEQKRLFCLFRRGGCLIKRNQARF